MSFRYPRNETASSRPRALTTSCSSDRNPTRGIGFVADDEEPDVGVATANLADRRDQRRDALLLEQSTDGDDERGLVGDPELGTHVRRLGLRLPSMQLDRIVRGEQAIRIEARRDQAFADEIGDCDHMIGVAIRPREGGAHPVAVEHVGVKDRRRPRDLADATAASASRGRSLVWITSMR